MQLLEKFIKIVSYNIFSRIDGAHLQALRLALVPIFFFATRLRDLPLLIPAIQILFCSTHFFSLPIITAHNRPLYMFFSEIL
jgi:hypothetical protein